MVILGHNLGNSQVSVYRTIGPTLVFISHFGSKGGICLLIAPVSVLCVHPKRALRYSDDVMTNYHRKCVQILSGGKSVGNDNVDYFSLGECHHNARARGNQPGFRR